MEYGEAKKLTIFGADAGTYASFDPAWTMQYADDSIASINAVAINPIDDTVYGVARTLETDGLLNLICKGTSISLYRITGAFPELLIVKVGSLLENKTDFQKWLPLQGFANPAAYVAHVGNQDFQNVGIDIGGFEMDGNDLVIVEIDGVEAAVWYDGDGHKRVVVVEGVNTATRTVQSYDVTGQVAAGGAGALYTFVDGEVYFSLNSGNGFYQFIYDTDTPYIKTVLDSTEQTGYNDGMNCTTEPSPLPLCVQQLNSC